MVAATAQCIDQRQATAILSVQVEQVKLLHPRLAVLYSVCVRGRHNLISAGERCLVHVRPAAGDVRGLCENLGATVGRGGSSGRWVEAEASPVLVLRTDAKRSIDRNRKGVRVIECDEIMRVGGPGEDEGSSEQIVDLFQGNQDDATHSVSDKGERHRIFAQWLVETYGVDALSSGSGVLDIAGGNGELSRALSAMGVPAVLVDPDPRCEAGATAPFEIVASPLHGDGMLLTDRTDRVGDLVRRCSLVAGMHPDQATEPIVDMALRLGVPFAVLPCCVMPRLFPFRMQKRHGDPVRSYSAFCQYLLDKAPEGKEFRVDHLPFVGRNKVISWKCAINATIF